MLRLPEKVMTAKIHGTQPVNGDRVEDSKKPINTLVGVIKGMSFSNVLLSLDRDMDGSPCTLE
jgi:hypothetical protein